MQRHRKRDSEHAQSYIPNQTQKPTFSIHALSHINSLNWANKYRVTHFHSLHYELKDAMSHGKLALPPPTHSHCDSQRQTQEENTNT